MSDMDMTSGAVTPEVRAKSEKLLKMFFTKGQTANIIAKENSLKVTNICSKPVTYATLDGYYESRDIYEKREPSYYSPSIAPYKVSATNYNKWELQLKDYAKAFVSEKTTFTLDDSRYVEDCFRCNTKGDVECTVCRNGYETCPTCNGYRTLRCGYCNGSGEVYCSLCNGSGKIHKSGVVGYNDDNMAIYGDWDERCYECDGAGTVTCGNCNGYGNVQCGTCGGYGEITCRTCNGTTRVTCDSCRGAGYFLNCVCVDQEYNTNKDLVIIDDYKVDSNRYKEKFNPISYNKNDVCTYEYISDEPILSSPNADLNLADSNLNTLLKNCGDAKYIKYRVREFIRDVVEVEYTIDNYTYYAMIDLSTAQIIMNSNPYEFIAENLLDDVKSMAARGQMKSFLEGYEDLGRITQDSNVKYTESDYKSIKTKLDIEITLIAAIITFALEFTIIKRAFSYRDFLGYLFTLLFIVAPVLLVNRLWEKLALTDNRILFYVFIAIPIAIMSFVFRYICYAIF